MQEKTSEDSPRTAFGNWGVDLSTGDKSVAPGEDFFRYVNGKWVDEFELPHDKVTFGLMGELHDQSEERVLAIIDELIDADLELGSSEQKIRDLYLSYMDEDRVNDLGLDPIGPTLSMIRGISSVEALVSVFARAGLDGTYSPITWDVVPDAKSPDRQLLTLGVASLSLPDRDFYLQDLDHFKAILGHFENHIVQVLELVGQSDVEARSSAKAILALERHLAEVYLPRSEMREVDKMYNVYNVADLNGEFSGIDWTSFFRLAELPKIDEANVTTPKVIRDVIEQILDTPLPVWRAYLTYKLLVSSAAYLSDELDSMTFDFYGRILNGQQEQRPRWKRAIGLVSSVLGDAVGQLYVERHFGPEAKREMDKIVANVIAAFAERIESAPWMSNATREAAKTKLGTFLPKIGYPNKWKNYSSLEICSTTLYENSCRARSYRYNEMVEKLGKPTDRDEWFMSPQTVNAYYNPLFNEIVFPAAILQPPFFDPAADPAVNYGAIGAVICHEMGHGFDDQGRKFDERGVLRQWWSESDIANFRERADRLVEQFNEYELLPDARVNGELTLGENIGDLGGLTLGYYAYQRSLNGEVAPVLDGLTGDQRFFLSYGQIWRSKSRDEFAVSMLRSGVHSPPVFRVNGALRNVDAWYEAFDIGPESPWYLPPDKRVSIW